MEVIEPSVRVLMTEMQAKYEMKKIEICGRLCYKSEDKIKDYSYIDFLRGIIKRGHESVIEHTSVTVIVICDRGVSHEIVRHRIGSYSQESTRYCNYRNSDIKFIRPYWISKDIANIINSWSFESYNHFGVSNLEALFGASLIN